jgi:hypothetical protein
MAVLTTAVRVRNRARQEMIARVPSVRGLVERRHAERVRQYAPALPAVPDNRADVLRTVREEGVCVTTLDALALPGSTEMQAAVLALKAELKQIPAADSDTTRPPLDAVLRSRVLWQWGLGEELLDMVENHLGLPARYYGADVRRECSTARTVGVRQWHRDIEDHRMFKILIWLNDVDAGGGPFEYVSRRHTDPLTRDLHYVSGFVSDDELEQRVPRSDWMQATGPQWTCVVADTRNLFHRAMPPVQRDRYSVTFSYTSRAPVLTLPSPSVTAAQRATATQGLNARQRACLPRTFTD